MSQNLTCPWIYNMVNDKSSYATRKNPHSGSYRVQVIKTLQKDVYEISDKQNYIRCAFSKKSLTKFKRNHSRTDHLLLGAIIQITELTLSYEQSPAYIHIKDIDPPWIFVTKFSAVGFVDRQVIGEPRCTTIPRFLLSDAVDDNCTTKSLSDKTHPTTSRTSSASISLSSIPFLSDMEASWGCEELWHSLAVNLHAVPFYDGYTVDCHEDSSKTKHDTDNLNSGANTPVLTDDVGVDRHFDSFPNNGIRWRQDQSFSYQLE